MLALVHISARHFVPDILAEAREEFPATEAPRDFDAVEIPLPERGGPELVGEGALAGGPEATSPSPEAAAPSPEDAG
jgi:ribonuclease Z